MTVAREPKTKKSYHSKAVPAAEATTTVLRPGSARVSAASVIDRLPPPPPPPPPGAPAAAGAARRAGAAGRANSGAGPRQNEGPPAGGCQRAFFNRTACRGGI